jgi:hypothetical protein
VPTADDLLGLILGCGCQQKCCCPEKDSTTPRPSNLFQSQPRTVQPPRLPDDSPFIPPAPQSLGTGQRTGDFGYSVTRVIDGYVAIPLVLPSNNAAGHPASVESSTDANNYRENEFVLDDGIPRSIEQQGWVGQGVGIDHQARVLRPSTWLEHDPPYVTNYSSPNELMTSLPIFRTNVDGSTEDVGSESRGLDTKNGWFAEVSLLTTLPSSNSETDHYHLIENRAISYADASLPFTIRGGYGTLNPQTRSRFGQVVQFKFRPSESAGSSAQTPLRYRLRAARGLYTDFTGITQVNISWGAQALVTDIYGQDKWLTLTLPEYGTHGFIPVGDFGPHTGLPMFDPEELDTLPDSGDLDAVDQSNITWIYSRSFTTWTWIDRRITEANMIRPPVPAPGVRWRSPDGRVTVFGPATLDHALLRGSAEVLTTPVGDFAGPGSWGAYRGTQGQTVILVQTGDTMTRIDIPELGECTSQTVPLADFTATLQGRPFGRFSAIGPAMSAWPPHEALVITTDRHYNGQT